MLITQRCGSRISASTPTPSSASARGSPASSVPTERGSPPLLEAIAFAMYGVPAVRGNRDSIRRRNAEPRTPVLVELDFALGAHTYKVTRTLTKAELFQDGGAEPIANSLATVTERITRLLGMIRDEFFNTYFTGQKELAVMAEPLRSARADFLNRVPRLRAPPAPRRTSSRRSGPASAPRIATLEQSLPDPATLDAEEKRAIEQLNGAEAEIKSADAALQEADTRVAEARPRWDAAQSLRERVVSSRTSTSSPSTRPMRRASGSWRSTRRWPPPSPRKDQARGDRPPGHPLRRSRPSWSSSTSSPRRRGSGWERSPPSTK